MASGGPIRSAVQSAGSAREEFAEEFNALYVASGCRSLRSLADSAKRKSKGGPVQGCAVSAQRISDWKAGRNVPARFDVLHPVLLVLIESARRRDAKVGVVLSVPAWRQLWNRAQAIRAVSAHTAGWASSADMAGGCFTGREVATRALADLVDTAVGAPDGRIIAVTGASGVGKSTLLNVGLTARLKETKPQQLTVRTIVLGGSTAQTLASISEELRRAREDGRGMGRAGELEEGVAHVVVVDQVEMMFGDPVPADSRERIVAQLGLLTEVAVVIVCVRSDHIPDCYEFPLLAEALDSRHYVLEPMNTAELRSVIRTGLHRPGGDADPGLEEALIATLCGFRGDTGFRGREPAELPILTGILRSMAEGRHMACRHVDIYRRNGGAEGIVQVVADNLWNRLSSEQRAEAEQILLGLVSVHTDLGYVRRRLHHGDAARLRDRRGVHAVVLRELIDARLVTVDLNELYLSHDLVLTWSRLRTWLEAGIGAGEGGQHRVRRPSDRPWLVRGTDRELVSVNRSAS
ncbi:ATP-binding protein [Nocardia asteroides]|uniref:ATP-binding protein n=1 Tax=Nocardia asteroides TaxID=1824 RepID=UPI003653D2D6